MSVTIPPMFVQDPERRNLNNYVHANHEYDDYEKSNNEHLMRVVLVTLRGLCCLFSFLCFVILLTVKDFHKTDTYNYVLAMSLLAMVYNVFQIIKGINELANDESESPSSIKTEKIWAMVNFIGDQVVSYMVLSGASAGLAATNEGRQSTTTSMVSEGYYEKAGAASSMLIVAFMVLLFPTFLSFQRLSKILTNSY